jgi:hypothetical protein
MLGKGLTSVNCLVCGQLPTLPALIFGNGGGGALSAVTENNSYIFQVFLQYRPDMDSSLPNPEEDDFRRRYAAEISKMTDLQLNEERQKIKHQGMKTPNRRGEQIKHEEIDREIVRRHRRS